MGEREGTGRAPTRPGVVGGRRERGRRNLSRLSIERSRTLAGEAWGQEGCEGRREAMDVMCERREEKGEGAH